jgi:hypothetical protein
LLFTAKSRKIQGAINAKTNKQNKANIILVKGMVLLDAKLERTKEMAIGYKKLKE